MPKLISALTPADFEPHIGEGFALAASGGEHAFKLIEVKRLGTAVREGGAFALTFLSPPGPFLPQAIYPITHPELGTMDLFLVPLGVKDGANSYEAVFT